MIKGSAFETTKTMDEFMNDATASSMLPVNRIADVTSVCSRVLLTADSRHQGRVSGQCVAFVKHSRHIGCTASSPVIKAVGKWMKYIICWEARK
ncbi:hypothetical protein Droror1_Dr00024158 [Drosera rotundifolia]